MADEPKIFIDEDWKARAQREKGRTAERIEAEAAARPARPGVPPADDTGRAPRHRTASGRGRRRRG